MGQERFRGTDSIIQYETDGIEVLQREVDQCIVHIDVAIAGTVT
jgi:hypothetical protein